MKKSRLILTLYLSAITLCIATFSMSIAWYNSSTHLQISTIDITIDCDRQLAISTKKDSGFVSILETEDFEKTGLFTPVTSAHQSTWLEKKKDMPVFYDDALYSEIEDGVVTQAAKGGYLSQKLYVKSDDDVYVSIKPEETYIHPQKASNVAYAEQLYEVYQSGYDEELKKLTKEEIENRLNSLVKAMRYSILVNDENSYQYVIIDPNKETDTYYGGILDNNVDRYYDYFIKDDGSSYERLYGEFNDKSYIVYDEAMPADSDYVDVDTDPSAFNARHKNGIRTINFEKSVENGLKIEKENSYSVTDFANKEKPFHFPVYRDNPTEIVFSIYIEGWDLDSINYTMGATFIANMVLEIEGEMLYE